MIQFFSLIQICGLSLPQSLKDRISAKYGQIDLQDGAKEEYDNYSEEHKTWWLKHAYWLYSEKNN